MNEIAKNILTYVVPILALLSVIIAIIRRSFYYFNSDELEKHLQSPPRRFISNIIPIAMTMILILAVTIVAIFNRLNLSYFFEELKEISTGQLISLVIAFIALYLVLIIEVYWIMALFRKDSKRLWYIAGEHNDRIYISHKTYDGTYVCYIVPNSDTKISKRTILKLEDISYPNVILRNKEGKNKIQQFWKDVLPTSTSIDIKELNLVFNLFIAVPFIIIGVLIFLLWVMAIKINVGGVLLLFLVLFIFQFIMYFPFFRAKLFRYVLKRRIRILKWKFKKWKKYGYKKFNIDKKY
ncbi:hypothetical protein HCA78_11505 [Listeria booriae]|uniref:Uncharacterized protein n=1 Tax=Listeria booriae TaxID=1552123 RepID=A0A842D357_9LIST|nr:hypothetical protein [Listeria booriae]MBC2004397.1 hypothetical protein [Listeria booriae]